MDYVTIYRIDERTSSHRGPFIYGKENLTQLARMLECCDPSDMASAQDDVPGFIKDHHVCGFMTLDDLYHRFAQPMLQWLHEEDYVLSVYEVPKDQVIFGREQCAFHLKEAQRRIRSLV